VKISTFVRNKFDELNDQAEISIELDKDMTFALSINREIVGMSAGEFEELCEAISIMREKYLAIKTKVNE
jgi:hypothetical protein